MGSELATGFDCGVCGEHHDILPLSYSVKFPLAMAAIPEAEVERRVQFTPDLCVVDGSRFYIRGRIPVPVEGLDEPFIWGVWAEISPKNFVRTNDLWRTEGRENEPEYSGWLDTAIPLYGDTINLEVAVHTQPVGRRPHFFLRDQEHALAVEQREGISMRRVEEISELILHADSRQ